MTHGPYLRAVDRDARRFAARMTRGGRLGVLRLPFLEDAWGGLEAAQPELVAEALLSIIDNAIVVYLAYRDVEVAPGNTPLEALRGVAPDLAERAWSLMREHTDSEAGAAERFRRVARFVEEELGLPGPVRAAAGGVTEPEYLRFRYASVYPAILLAEALDALRLFPVPETYRDASHEALKNELVSFRRLSVRRADMGVF